MTAVLKLSAIKIGTNPRKDFSNVDALADSIKKIGLVQPLVVREVRNTDLEGEKVAFTHVLVDGECRMRALRKLGTIEAPVHVIKTEDDTAHREAQMMANLCRSDLTLIERMRGFAALLEAAPARYNAAVVARKFGYKEKDVTKMVSTVKRIHPACDETLAAGLVEWQEIDDLSQLPKEFQPKVIQNASRTAGGSIRNTIYRMTEDLYFDEVFGEAKAKAAGKVHYKPSYGSPRTFDKDYAAKIRADFEARTKKKYDAEKARAKKKDEAAREQSAEQKKKAREKEAKERADGLASLKTAVERFVAQSNTLEHVHAIIEKEVRRIGQNDLRILLRAFGVEFKAAESTTDDLRKLVRAKVFEPIIASPTQAVMLVAMLDINRPYACDAGTWAKAILKAR